jgi:hypothetical protein
MKGVCFIISALFITSLLYASEEVEIKDNTPFWYIRMDFQKNWDYVPNAIDSFLLECRKQGIQSAISNNPFLIVFNGQISLWGIACKANESIIIKPPLKISY